MTKVMPDWSRQSSCPITSSGHVRYLHRVARRDCRHDYGSAGGCGDRVAHRDRRLRGALSALAQEKCDDGERNGDHRPNHPRENIERGLSAHDAPHGIAEQRLPSLETLSAWRDFASARIDARCFDAPYEVMRVARSRRRLRLRRSRHRSGRDGAPPVGRSEHRSAAAQQTR